jgi:OOP family OmpA-OmpF porin
MSTVIKNLILAMKSIINIIMEAILSLQLKKTPAVQLCIAKDKARKTFIVIFAVIISMQVSSQVDQRIAMADKYFDEGEYYTAAGLYEQYLNPSKKTVSQANFPLNSRRYNQGRVGSSVNKFDIIYKQAESYRLSNHWQEAAEGYKECFEKDKVNYADAFYWYAVCQRSLRKFDLAEEHVKQFLSHDLSGKYRHDADKELQTIRFIKEQLSRPDTIYYKIKKNHTDLGNEKGIFALTSLQTNQFIFTSTVTDPVINKEESPNHSRLFIAALNDGILKNSEPLKIDGVDASINQGAATISVDKKTLYFTQWKKENGKNISSIYYSKKEGNTWGKPVLVSSINKNGFSSKQPYCSSDGKTLFFASDMPGGSGGFDIWYAAIQADGTIDTPVNAGNINTKDDELAPFYHNTTNQLVFASNGMMGMGGYDLYTSKMKESVFELPENMGYPVNSSRDDIYFYAPEKNELLKNAVLGSDRGSECCLETYTVVKTAKKKTVSGIVLDCKTNEPLSDAIVIMKGAAEKSLEIKTGPDGRFKFELAGDINQQNFSVSKEDYKEKTERANVESLDN